MDTVYFGKLKKMLEHKSEILKAIAHPVRLCILTKLMIDEKCSVSNLQCCVNVPQPTISQHLSKLKAAGILDYERNGVIIEYRIASNETRELMALILKENI